MKTILINSTFGITEAKIKKQFEILGAKFAVVDYPCQYMNAKEPLIMKSVVEVSTGTGVGLFFSHQETIKGMVAKTIEKITGIVKTPEDLKVHISQFKTINS